MTHKQNQLTLNEISPPDYLVIGHVTSDLVDSTTYLGGTATFSALTSQALGMRPGIITASSMDCDLAPLNHFWLSNTLSPQTTTFENISNGGVRLQFLYHTALPISAEQLPSFNSPPKIVHLGPVANEVDPNIIESFPNSFKCLTPQGWFRTVNGNNRVLLRKWAEAEKFFSKADIAIISVEDVLSDEETIAKLASSIPILVVTESQKGARVYWHNDARFIKAPEVECVNDTGAGDIFATAFFCRYYSTKDPWESGRFATLLASWSVTRSYLESIPLPDEISRARMEFIKN